MTELTKPCLRNNDPNRLQIPASSHRHFSSLARRLGRIFAHAYFHHREAFEQAEAESSLYARFLSLSSKFDLVPNEFLVIPTTTPTGDGDEDGNGESGGFGSREVKLGTSYDPRRSVGGGSGTQYQLQRPFQDEFLAVHKMKRLPQQYQQFPHQPQSPQQQQQHESQQIQRQPKLPPMGGAESPRKTGRNRTHTMVLSEAAQVADELAKVTAAANIRAEKEEGETKEKEVKAREEVESEQRQKDEAEPKAQQETEEPASDEPASDEPKDIDEGVIETTEENVSEGERVGESTGNVAIEEEPAVEVLHVALELEPTGNESEPEETDANLTKVGEEPRVQEVDIASASISAETSNVEEGEGSFEADTEAEVQEDRKEVL